jgi:D-alanyl-D-alanine carboxypeptidase/D-alanyl-D-alanine-endopeptidase (penicillin-binding protein 4)
VRRLWALIVGVGCVLALTASAAATRNEGAHSHASSLRTALARALASPYVDPERTGAFAVDLRSGRVVFQTNPGLSLAPASAEKLAVAFAALRVLGPAFRFRTEVLGAGELDRHAWRGDLHLVGLGDPTLGPADLDALARGVAAWGIRRVTGSVVGDESHYDARRGVRGWKPSFLGNEAPPLSALSVDGVPIRSANASAAVTAAAFSAALSRRGIAVRRPARTGRAPTDVLPLALDLSDPLAVIVRQMNRESQNFVAEMLLKQIGAAAGPRGTSAAGAAVVRTTLEDAGVPMSGVRVVDGSGLSLLDRLTARALVVLLRTAERDPEIRDAFLFSLPVAGISGTLRDRLRRRPFRGQIIAKTGTTSGASALAGFVRRRYVFAILQNGSPVNYWSARAAQDRFVRRLVRS